MRSNGQQARHLRDAQVITSAADNSGMGVTPPQARGSDGPVHHGLLGMLRHMLGRS